MAQLVIQTAFPGDLLLSIPLLKQIRVYYPDQPIVLLCRSGLGEFFMRERLVDEVIEVDKRDRKSLRQTLKELRNREWQNIFCPHESYRSAIWVRSLRARGWKVGFKKWWNFWAFTKRVEKPVHLPDALRQLSLLREVQPHFQKIWDDEMAKVKWRSAEARVDVTFTKATQIPEWASMRVLERKKAGTVIYLAPGSVWPTKRWSENGFVELANKFRALGTEVAFVGSPDERDLCDRLAQISGAKSLAGQTSFAQLIDLFGSGQALIANDSGAMHAAAVAGLPTVAIFGPTVLDFGFRPWQERASVVQLDLPCRPCAAHGGKTCPIGTHACMRDLPAAQVEQALLELIQNSR